ncbi:MAG TPA: hypothetical protein EYP98_00100, partial [Planctomycetes bacterium]|nr:hypothetical protein [Planctomycetota bacterium]
MLRPFAMLPGDDPEDVRLLNTFASFCRVPGQEASKVGATAFTLNWLAFSKEQQTRALEARGRFMERYEWPSLWETTEVQQAFLTMWEEECADRGEELATEIDPEYCHDLDKPRATVEHYVALVGWEVAVNLEAVARARLEKRPRQYQTDAAVHQAYVRATSGGGEAEGDDEALAPDAPGDGPRPTTSYFEPMPWDISPKEMREVLDFGHRLRLTAFAKELLALPCMQRVAGPPHEGLDNAAPAWGAQWRRACRAMEDCTDQGQLRLAELQAERLTVNPREDDMDLEGDEEDGAPPAAASAAPPASFANQDVYATPGAYIRSVVDALPAEEKLTWDQTLFVARFARSCDEAWEDEAKPPEQRRVHHILLLGQGGSGKTHVVQNIVFQVTRFLWPPGSLEEPTLMVVASSNAQAKNISTETVKARTIHNATGMRVQRLVNPLMRPGNKLNHLKRLWGNVRVLIVEEVSMVAAAMYNMLDFRSMHRRSQAQDVNETNYTKPGPHFG